MKENELLSVASLTGGELAGTGLFEELMRSVHGQLVNEFNGGRIAGHEYTQAYTQSMSYALQFAVQYLLQYPITNKQLALMDAQIEEAAKKNELLDLQRKQLEIQNAIAQIELECIAPERCKQAKIQTFIAMEQQEQAVISTSIAKSEEYMKEVQEQIVDEQLKDAQAKNQEPIGGMNRAAYDRALVEIELLQQKLNTEKSQTQDTIEGQEIGGLVGSEIAIKKAQAATFIRNAEVQAAKLFTDTYSTLYTTEPENLSPNERGFSKENINNIMKTVANGVGIEDIDWKVYT